MDKEKLKVEIKDIVQKVFNERRKRDERNKI